MAEIEFFPHNWQTPVEMTTYYQTDIVRSAYDAGESRRALWPWPRRRIGVRWTAITREEATRILFALQHAGFQRYRMPVYQDEARVSSGGAAGTTINLVAGEGSYRRFKRVPTTTRPFRYSKALIAKKLPNGRLGDHEIFDVWDPQPNSIETVAALSTSYPEGSLVYPILDVEIELNSELQAYSYDKADLEHTFLEVFELGVPPTVVDAPPSELYNDALLIDGGLVVAPGTTPPTLKGRQNWRENFKTRILTVGSSYEQGRNDVNIAKQGGRAYYEYEVNATFTTGERSLWFSLMKLFDSRRGRCSAFRMVSPMAIFTPTAVAAGSVTVMATGATFDNLFDVTALGPTFWALVLLDGTIRSAQLTSTTDLGGGLWRLNMSGTPFTGVSFATIERVAHCPDVRFSEDGITEKWHNTDAVEVTFKVREIPAYTGGTIAPTNPCV